MAGDLDGVDYHQFSLVFTQDPEFVPDYPMSVDGTDPEAVIHCLIAPSGPSVRVETGIAMGVVGLTVEFLDAPPSAVDATREWESVAELSIEALDSVAHVQLLGAAPAPPFDLFALPAGPGWYRLRAHAVGRSLDFDAVVVGSPREHHFVQLWRTAGSETECELRRDNRWEHQSP
jgi:hypothetical protein